MHTVQLDAFLIDATCVTNAQFATFVKATGYRTEAEQFGSSAVFHLAVRRELGRTCSGSRAGRPGGSTSAAPAGGIPKGLGSTITDRQNHPVVHVSWHDARPTARGPASGCRPRRSGSTPPAEASSRSASRGATS